MNTSKTPPGGTQILSAAIDNAQSIIAAAEQRANELREAAKRAYDEARSQGYAEGLEQGRLDAARMAVRLLEERAVVEERLSLEAAKLAVAICESVMGEAVKVDPQIVRRIAERALQQSISGDSVAIYVHPDDESVMTAAIDRLRRIAGSATVTIEVDRAVSRGGCVIRTEFGEVDASLELLLSSVAQRLGLQHD